MKEVRTEFSQGIVDQLLKDLKYGDEASRRFAAEDLGYGQYEEGIPGLVEVLSDSSIAVSEAGADALVSIGGVSVAKAVAPLLATEGVRERNYAAEILSLLGEPAVSVLAVQLASENRDVRKFAVDTLALIRSPNSLGALITALDDSDVNVAASAADGIGEIGDESHLSILEKYLSTQVWMRCSIIRAIGLIGGERAYQIVVGSLMDDDLMVKVSAVQALANISDERSVSDLLQLLERELIDLFGNEVLSALEKILQGNPFADYCQLCEKVNLAPIVQLMQNENREIKIKAVRFLGYGKFPNYPKEMVNFLYSEDSEVRKETVWAINQIGFENIDALCDVLDNEEASIETKAAVIHCIGCSKAKNRFEVTNRFLMVEDSILRRVALDTLGDGSKPVPTKEVIENLSHPHEEVRISAAGAMGRLKLEEFIRPLIEQFNDSSSEVVDEADKALVSIGNRNVDPIILPYFDSNQESHRLMAYLYFSKHNPETVKEKFVSGISDKNEEIRAHSYIALQDMGILDLELVKKAIDDSNDNVNLVGARLLGLLPLNEEIVTFIREQMSLAKKERVRVEMVRVLGGGGAYGAVSILQKLLHDDSIWVQIETVDALRSIGDDSVVDDLKELLNSTENDDLADSVSMAIEDLDI